MTHPESLGLYTPLIKDCPVSLLISALSSPADHEVDLVYAGRTMSLQTLTIVGGAGLARLGPEALVKRRCDSASNVVKPIWIWIGCCWPEDVEDLKTALFSCFEFLIIPKLGHEARLIRRTNCISLEALSEISLLTRRQCGPITTGRLLILNNTLMLQISIACSHWVRWAFTELHSLIWSIPGR